MGMQDDVYPDHLRLHGDICYLCDRPLLDVPRRVIGVAEPRTCPACPPHPHCILCHVSGGDLVTVHYTRARPAPGDVRVGPWELLGPLDEPATEAAVLAILRWGNASPATLELYQSERESCVQTSVFLWLNDAELAELTERGRGRPWNGFELLNMHAAGLYPPAPLTPAQEADYHRRHAEQDAKHDARQKARQDARPRERKEPAMPHSVFMRFEETTAEPDTWRVTFAAAGRTVSTCVVQDAEALEALAERGAAFHCLADRQAFAAGLRQRRGQIELHLTDEQWRKLTK